MHYLLLNWLIVGINMHKLEGIASIGELLQISILNLSLGLTIEQ